MISEKADNNVESPCPRRRGLRVLDIVEGTSVDGPGLRTSVYFAGCTHHCPGCHNPQSWDAGGGESVSVGDLLARIAEAGADVTLSGGDPMMQIDAGLIELAEGIRRLGLGLWCYTGYTYEEVCASPSMRRLLPWLDVLVDGRFVQSLRDTTLQFRGSSNQRLVDVKASVAAGRVVEWHSSF